MKILISMGNVIQQIFVHANRLLKSFPVSRIKRDVETTNLWANIQTPEESMVQEIVCALWAANFRLVRLMTANVGRARGLRALARR